MSALAEALVAAQARALASIGRTYVGSTDNGDDARQIIAGMLDKIGCTDKIEQGYLIACWDALRVAGVQAPPEQKQNGPDRSKATDAQLSLMRKIASERNYVLPDDPQLLSRDDASKVIDSMKSGEYDQATWAVPF